MRTFPGGSTKDERENTEERFKDMENGMRRSDICHTFKKERMNECLLYSYIPYSAGSHSENTQILFFVPFSFLKKNNGT